MQIVLPALELRGSHCVCNVWRLVSFKEKFGVTGEGRYFTDVCENRGSLESRLADRFGFNLNVLTFHWFYKRHVASRQVTS